MILSDIDLERAIRDKQIVVEPLGPDAIQPASVDVRLGMHALRMNGESGGYIDPALQDTYQTDHVTIPPRMANTPAAAELAQQGKLPSIFLLYPQQFMLAEVMEYMVIPAWAVGFVNGRSSLGRLGLVIHATAGLLDPGWEGRITLELFNQSSRPIRLWHTMSIATVVFQRMQQPAERPYGHATRRSKYQGNDGVEKSRYWMEGRPRLGVIAGTIGAPDNTPKAE